MQDEKVTIQVAAKALNVTPKTVHQWLRTGTLTRIKDGNRTYILMDEVRALRQNRVTNQKSEVITSEGKNEQVTNQGYDIVPLKREHYEGLLTRLGQLEANQQLLLEYKEDLQKKEAILTETKESLTAQAQELDQAKEVIVKKKQELSEAEKFLAAKNKIMQQAGEKIRELEAENARLRLPWYKKLFGGK